MCYILTLTWKGNWARLADVVGGGGAGAGGQGRVLYLEPTVDGQAREAELALERDCWLPFLALPLTWP